MPLIAWRKFQAGLRNGADNPEALETVTQHLASTPEPSMGFSDNMTIKKLKVTQRLVIPCGTDMFDTSL